MLLLPTSLSFFYDQPCSTLTLVTTILNKNCNSALQHWMWKTRSETWGRYPHNLQSDKHACWSAVSLDNLGLSLLFLMFWENFRRQGMFSSLDGVYVVSISWDYVGLGNWAKIERNDAKLLCVKTSLVDWRVRTVSQ